MDSDQPATKLQPTYSTILSLIENKTPEDLHLEFKAADVITNSQTETIAKAVSAFANSDGGSLVIGVKSKKHGEHVTYADELRGLDGAKDKTEWLEQLIESNTYPSVWNYKVFSIISPSSGRFYWIKVDRSRSAPQPVVRQKVLQTERVSICCNGTFRNRRC